MKEHVRQRGSTWTYWIDAGKDVNGRRRQMTKGGFKTEKDARAAARRAMVTIDDSGYVAPTHETIETFMRRWLASLQLQPNTIAYYRTLTEKHIIPALGNEQVRRLTSDQLNAFYSELLKTGRRTGKLKGTGLAPITVSKVHATIHAALAAGVKSGTLLRNVSDAASAPSARSKSEMHVWSAEELARFLEFVADDRLSSLYRVIAMTGMRRGEALGLRWKDVDLVGRRLSIVQTVITVDYQVMVSTPKTGRGRSVAIDAATVEALKAHKRRQVDERSAFDVSWPGPDSLVFAGLEGEPLHPDGFSDRFARLVKRAGLPPITVHDLRHTYATLALQDRIPAKIVSERLGHSTVGMTLDTYSHVTPEMDEDTAERVAGLILKAR